MGNTIMTHSNALMLESRKKKELEDKNKLLRKRIKNLEDKLEIKNYSNEEINELLKLYVRDMLKDDNINSNIIPDYIEEKIYVNCLKLCMGMLSNGLENSQINLLNKKFKLSLQPDIKKE
jgi:hypothetical protein